MRSARFMPRKFSGQESMASLSWRSPLPECRTCAMPVDLRRPPPGPRGRGWAATSGARLPSRTTPTLCRMRPWRTPRLRRRRRTSCPQLTQSTRPGAGTAGRRGRAQAGPGYSLCLWKLGIRYYAHQATGAVLRLSSFCAPAPARAQRASGAVGPRRQQRR